MKRSLSLYTRKPKGGKIPEKKQLSLLVHSVLYRAVIKVDMKVTDASLIQGQCLKCVLPALTHAEIPRDHAALLN